MRRIVVALVEETEIASVDMPDATTDEEVDGLIAVIGSWFGGDCAGGSCPVPPADPEPPATPEIEEPSDKVRLASTIRGIESSMTMAAVDVVRSSVDLPSKAEWTAHGSRPLVDLQRLGAALTEASGESLPPEPGDGLAALADDVADSRGEGEAAP